MLVITNDFIESVRGKRVVKGRGIFALRAPASVIPNLDFLGVWQPQVCVHTRATYLPVRCGFQEGATGCPWAALTVLGREKGRREVPAMYRALFGPWPQTLATEPLPLHVQRHGP